MVEKNRPSLTNNLRRLWTIRGDHLQFKKVMELLSSSDDDERSSNRDFKIVDSDDDDDVPRFPIR